MCSTSLPRRIGAFLFVLALSPIILALAIFITVTDDFEEIRHG